jgi:DNA-binding MarR family transcriptional regulator
MSPGGEHEPDADRLRRFLRIGHIFSASVQEIVGSHFLAESTDHPLTLSQLHLLKLLANNGGHKVSDAATLLGVSSPAATKCIDKLERLGLLSRAPSTSDRRATMLIASAAGRDLVREYERVNRKRLEPVLAGFSPDEIDKLTDLLERVAVALFDKEGSEMSSCLCCGAYIDNDCSIARVRGNCPYQEMRVERSTESGLS